LAHGLKQGPRVVSLAKSLPISLFALQAFGLAGIASLILPKLRIPFGVSIQQTAADATPTSTEESPWNLTLSCPVDFKAGKIDLKEVTRYPMLFSFGFAALGTSLASPYLSLRLLAGFPIIMAVIGGMHQDHRRLRSGDLDLQTYEKTSLLPFVALVKNGGWEKVQVPWVNVALGVSIALALARRRHTSLATMSSNF
jgi:uncharacterized membrane protein